MRFRFCSVLSLVAVLLVMSMNAYGEVKVASLFTDGMVLQRDMPVPVWGWAAPGEEIKLEYCDTIRTVKADDQGDWKVQLDPMKVGKPFTLTISGENEIQVKNVLVGEVWLCSGQSNMAFTVDRCLNAEEEIAQGNYPDIRMFSVKNSPDFYDEAKDAVGQWQVCSPETVGKFSASGYFFGRNLHKELGVPIGLINSSWGGTPIEAWTQKSALATLPSGKAAIAACEARVKAYDPATAQNEYEKAMQKWKKDKEAGVKRRAPRTPVHPMRQQGSPGALFNGRIAPLIPYAIRGAIWYQGEANSSTLAKALDYRNQLPLMIGNWREKWGEGDFPFIYVQLPNYDTTRFWPAMRESMLETLKTPNTGMVIAIDIGEAKDIHPKNKQEIGRRLALIALHDTYAKDLVYSGPIFESMKVDGDKAVLNFKHTGTGLVAKGDSLEGFIIAGEDKKFVPAKATVEGDMVVVTSSEVAVPVAVRYAWENNPECNLFNKEALPASPFRTDKWDLE